MPAANKTTEVGTTLQDQAYEWVKGRILNRVLRPGDYVTDSQIADQLNVSRTPVREALRKLEHEGFLIRQARKGWQVYSLTLDDIHEIFDIKVSLEGMLARRAADCDDSQKKATLQRTLERMRRAAEQDDHLAWREADAELHEIIFSMCANERAVNIINNLNEQWHRIRIGLVAMEGRIGRSNEEHEAFVNCIIAGDGDGAEKAMRMHLNNLRDELVQLLANLILPFAKNGV
jgi:DNA-binding GntR family transcriptional regulator